MSDDVDTVIILTLYVIIMISAFGIWLARKYKKVTGKDFKLFACVGDLSDD